MSQRRILLIDADREFHHLLKRELAPYGFEVVQDDSPHAIGRLQVLDAVALFIAVEEPERKGYALFNKAKKGVAATVPVVLVTSSVPPDVFANHRRLKVHADEYLDKRDLPIEVLIGKIDNLLGPLEEPSSEALPIEIDEMPLDDDVLVDEVDGADLDLGAIDDFADDSNRTMEAAPHMLDELLDAETEAAFAGLFSNEPAGPAPSDHLRRIAETRPRETSQPAKEIEVRLEPRPKPLPPVDSTPPPPDSSSASRLGNRGARPTSDGSAAPLPRLIRQSVSAEAIPEPISVFEASPTPDADLDDANTKDANAEVDSNLDQEPIAEFDASPEFVPPEFEPVEFAQPTLDRSDERDADSGFVQDELDPGDELDPSAEFVPIDELEASHVSVAPEFEPISEFGPNAELTPKVSVDLTFESPAADPEPQVTAVPVAIPVAAQLRPAKRSQTPAPLDLGLDEVAARADEEQSGVHDRRTLQKIHLVERENQRLKAELEKTRQSDAGSTQPQGREREFLNLRSMIIAKDKELLDLRDELTQKDREVVEARERVRQLQHAKTAVEGKNLELESRLLGDTERSENVELALQEARTKVGAVEQKVARLQRETERLTAQATESHAANQTAAAKLRDDLVAAQGLLDQAERNHAIEIVRIRGEQQRALEEATAAAAAQRDTLLAELAAELEQARLTEIRAVADEAQTVHDQLERAYREALADRDQQLIEANQSQSEALTAALAVERIRTNDELADVRASHELAVRQLQADRAAELAAALSQREEATHELEERMAQALAAAAQDREEARSTAEAESSYLIAAQIETLKSSAKADLAALQAGHDKALAEVAANHQHALDQQAAETTAMGAAVTERLLAEHQAALAEAIALANQGFSTERAQLETAAAAATAEYEARFTQEQRDLEARLVGEQNQLAALAAAERRTLIERYDAEHDRALAALAEEHEAAIAAERAAGEAAIAKQQGEHQTALAAISATGLSAQAAANTEHQQATAALISKHDAAAARILDEHRTALAAAAAERDQVSAKLATGDTALAAVAAERDQLSAKLATGDTALAALAAERDQLSAKLATGDTALAALAAERDQLSAKLATGDTALAALAAERDQLSAKLATGDTALAALAAERDQLSAKLATGDTALAALAAEREELTAMLAINEAARTSLLAERDRLTIRISTDETALARLQSEFDQLTAKVASDEVFRTATRLELEDLERGLSSTRAATRRAEGDLGQARVAITDRDRALAEHQAAIAARDQRIDELGVQIDELELENATYQEQVLKAYQKIKGDEAVVARAKKALAIALTALDDGPKPTS